MYIWNKEKERKMKEDLENKKNAEFKIFCFNKANEIAGEIDVNWLVLQFYEQGFEKLNLKQNFECWCSFSKKYKEFNNTKVSFQDEFLKLYGWYISVFENLLLQEFNCDLDYEAEYEKEKKNIIDFCFNKIMIDLEDRYEHYVGEKSYICIERIKKYK